jgi:cytosine/adenosine deaminase-related metal-dependent hydrolase
MWIRARTVLPIRQAPIANGAVEVRDGRIVTVGTARELKGVPRADLVDLGDVALLPGLINAHCHLDYTAMAGLIPAPRRFTDWIHCIMAIKNQWGFSEFAESWLLGARMLLETGTTTVADIEAVPELLPEVLETTPLRVHSFLELISLSGNGSADALLERSLRKIESLKWGRFSAGLSPHAPYSTTRHLVEASQRAGYQLNLRLTTHVAESQDEFDMFMYRRGPLFHWLNGQRDLADCGQGSPVQWLENAGLLNERFLAVHVNYLWDFDARRIGRSGASVVHCPSSHAYFGHHRFPRRELSEAGVNLALGTDSLASTARPRHGAPVLSMFAEMQVMAAHSSDLAPAELLRMATLNGARALGHLGELGEISPGAVADLIAVPCAVEGAAAEETVVQHRGTVSASMIGGCWKISPREVR